MKILVNKNEINASIAIDQVREEAKAVNTFLVPLLKKIGVALTDEILKDFLAGAVELKKAYDKEVAKDLNSLSNHAIRTQMSETAAQAWKDTEEQIALSKIIVRNAKHLKVVDGYCNFPPENEEKIRESIAIYITDPKEIEAYNLHLEIIEKMNQLFNGVVPVRWWVLFPENSTGQIYRNEDTNYQYLTGHGK